MIKLIGGFFDSFSYHFQIGYWQGISKNSICIEIDTKPNEAKIEQLCRDICKLNNQQAILVQQINSQSCLINGLGEIKKLKCK